MNHVHEMFPRPPARGSSKRQPDLDRVAVAVDPVGWLVSSGTNVAVTVQAPGLNFGSRTVAWPDTTGTVTEFSPAENSTTPTVPSRRR